VVQGQDVVDAIEKVRTGRRGMHDDVPVDDVVIERVVEVA
jgi:peptidyl-prolyl cis-trans isomerase B (cyclophilin B)